MKSFVFCFCFFVFAFCSGEADLQAQSQEAKEMVKEVGEMAEEELVAYAAAIHERVLTLDTHDDIPFNFATKDVDPGVRGSGGRQVDLPKMREGKLDVATFIVYLGQTARTPVNYRTAKTQAMVKFNAIHLMTKMYPDEVEIALTASDVWRIHRGGKLVAAIGIENGYTIAKDISLIEKYKELGANYMGLTHNGHNDIADSATPKSEFGDVAEEHGGVSEFGIEVIRELNRVGIMVDVSHASKKTSLQAAKLSATPIIASHSSVRALCDVPRNMDDEQMKALQATGGVMNIVSYGPFLIKNAGRRAAVSDLVDHIDYAVELIGIDHVGISSDFDGGGGIIGWDDASESGNVTLELVRRGYSEEQIAKLWSGNYLRVWAETERYAEENR